MGLSKGRNLKWDFKKGIVKEPNENLESQEGAKEIDNTNSPAYHDYVQSRLDEGKKKLREEIRYNWWLSKHPHYQNKQIFRLSKDSDFVKQISKKIEKMDDPSEAVFIFPTYAEVMSSDQIADIVFEKGIYFSSLDIYQITDLYCDRLHFLRSTKNKKPYDPDEYALEVGQIIHDFHLNGKLTLRDKEKALEEANIPTPRGKDHWNIATVRSIYYRWLELSGNKIDISRTYTKKSEDFAQEIGPIIKELEKEGFTSFQAKAEELTRREIKTYRGSNKWSPSSVLNVQKKYEGLQNS